MSRGLRRRTSRPDYAAILAYGEGDSEDADNMQHQTTIADPDSQSDFAPENEPNLIDDGELSPLSDNDDDENKDITDTDSPSATNKNPLKKSKGKKRPMVATPEKPRRHADSVLPSVHHRHRAIPLYQKKGAVERLSKKPRLFKNSELTHTNSWGSSRTVSTKVAKAWGYNVGPGPLWELLEDRGWLSANVECTQATEESKRRPRVYSQMRIQPAWEAITLA
jgi:transcription factor C subunit 6